MFRLRESHLASPTHVVVRGGADTVSAFGALGFLPIAVVPGAAELAVAGDGGRGRVVVDEQARAARGPIAIDIYTTDLDATVDSAVGAGWTLSGRAPIELGPLVMQQAMLLGPDRLRVVAIDANLRRPSLLDTDPMRRTSEVHSMVWQVGEHFDAAVEFWRDTVGLPLAFDAPVDHPGVAKVMDLPAGWGVRMAMFSDDEQRPARFELLAHLGDDVPCLLYTSPSPRD